MVICLERGADLHTVQLMPLPLTVSCSSKIQIGFTFLVPAYPGCPGKEAVKWLFFMLVLYCFCVATEFSVNKDLYIKLCMKALLADTTELMMVVVMMMMMMMSGRFRVIVQ